MVTFVHLRSLIGRAGVVLMLAFVALPPVFAAGFGNCAVLFVDRKAPKAPASDVVVPLCEEDSDTVFFATGYSKRDNHGYWSAYRLDEEQIAEMPEHPTRPNVKFKQNPKLKGGNYVQPRHDSYMQTGFDRGHLAPNGAMAWDQDAQRASFTISNIAPQNPPMNRNIWRCFEVSIRDWAADSGSTFVVVGTMRGTKTVSSTRDPNRVKINVPTHYIAMVYREKPAPRAIGVMVPNTKGHLDVRDFMMSVSDLERRTGYKFQLRTEVANETPNLVQWPTRILAEEFVAPPKDIDDQCPRVDAQ